MSDKTPGDYQMRMDEYITCPAGICNQRVPPFDPDRMVGHLMSKHRWTFSTASDYTVSRFPEDIPEPPDANYGGDNDE